MLRFITSLLQRCLFKFTVLSLCCVLITRSINLVIRLIGKISEAKKFWQTCMILFALLWVVLSSELKEHVFFALIDGRNPEG